MFKLRKKKIIEQNKTKIKRIYVFVLPEHRKYGGGWEIIRLGWKQLET